MSDSNPGPGEQPAGHRQRQRRRTDDENDYYVPLESEGHPHREGQHSGDQRPVGNPPQGQRRDQRRRRARQRTDDGASVALPSTTAFADTGVVLSPRLAAVAGIGLAGYLVGTAIGSATPAVLVGAWLALELAVAYQPDDAE